jgi:hypothetical protein
MVSEDSTEASLVIGIVKVPVSCPAGIVTVPVAVV